MRTIGAYEAKTNLPRLLDEVERGERITITKHGRPVAVLVPLDATVPLDVENVVQRFREFRKGNRLDGVTIRELIDDGRHW
jgi:prevent-host-death family protein